MLTYLSVSDFALIESVEVDFHPGLNVITGETGAGKTVLVGAIGLLLGDRADSLQVRLGASSARFQAVFALSALPLTASELERLGYIDEGETELILGRTVSSDGKSRCTVNGRLAPVAALADIGALLVEVHGQNTHQALLKPGTHLEYLDRFAGPGHLETLVDYRARHANLRSLLAEKRESNGEGRDPTTEAELLSHEIEVIDNVRLQPGELEELEADAKRMRHARELWELASRVEDALVGDDRSSFAALEMLEKSQSDMQAMVAHDEKLAPVADRLESIGYELEDVAAEVVRYRESLETDPERLEEVETRLSSLRDLFRRYGGSLEAVLLYREEASRKLARLEELASRGAVLDSEIHEEQVAISILAAELSESRKTSAALLERAVTQEMSQLELAGARVEVMVTERDVGASRDRETGPYGPSGTSEVEFLFSSQPSEPARPLRKIASGGEMSRVMLALKIVLAETDRLPVLIFDEVDAGIGGDTARKIGEKLRVLTGYHQVFCITHIPQIATFADWQYRVFKQQDDGSGNTTVELLDDESRIEEMCRMLGDSSGRKVTKEHARDILVRARRK